ncbi:tetratricopeptide repeat protein [Anoxybacteroides amylolyticum]|uniref:Tetratricopeptide repeat family protein n=1 Tax=Anoxybacteroides amylolyticum TaxID=294699 RepID=A0A160F247_9BACL|nr:tetratricopeptide repeat protein [Anoxybacillus amylolyticus]ANB59732.1 tetratricopeptide repeat family protein [Anoxybacillus amylolyticus]
MNKRFKTKRSTTKVIPFIQSGDYYFTKGLRAYRRRELYKAKKYLERAVHLEGNEAMFACQLAVVLSELGEYQASNEWLLKIVTELDSDMNECFYFLANNYAHLGLFREAMNYAEKYLEREPDGSFVEEVEDLIDLLSIEQEALDDQEDLIMKQEKARTLLEKGEFLAAIDALKAIIGEYPEFWSAYNNLALAYFYMGDTEQAQQILQEVLEKNPGNLHALCNRLVFSHYLRAEEDVADLAEQLACVHPFLTEHRYKLGATFALIGRFDLAFKWLRHLYKIGFDGDYSFYYWLSYSAYYTGHEQLAKTAWGKAMEQSSEKFGQEPWAVSSKLMRWLTSTDIAEVLYGLYMMSKSLTADELIGYQRVKSELPTQVQAFADYIFYSDKEVPSFVSDGYAVMDELWQRNLLADEQLHITWFRVFLHASTTELHFVNHCAWAAATEYVWRQMQGQSVTQKMMAQKYDISSATVQKYVKKVRQWLS